MPTISFSIGGEQHDITGLSGDEVCDMIKMNYIAEAETIKKEIANLAYTSPYMRGEIEEAKTTPIKKEIELNFAINVYDEVKYNVDKLDEELHSAWIDELYGEIEEMINDRIRMKLGETFNGSVVINDTGY